MGFEAFWRATEEPSFAALSASCTEFYRLSIETSLAPQHRVYRLQKSAGEPLQFVAHFFVFGANREEAAAKTHQIILNETLWEAFDVLLLAADFWQLPAESGSCGFDGSTYTLEAWKAGRRRPIGAMVAQPNLVQR